MEAIAHNPKFAKKAGVPQKVGEDFAAADEGKSEKELPEHVRKKTAAMLMKKA